MEDDLIYKMTFDGRKLYMVKYPFYSRGILHFAQLLQEHFMGYK